MVKDKIEYLKNSDVVRRIINGSIWNLLGSIFSQVLMLMSGIIVSRLISNTDFGKFSLIRSTISTFSIIIGLGLGVANTNLVSKHYLSNPQNAKNIIFTSLIITVGFSFTICVFSIIFRRDISELLFHNLQASNVYYYFILLLFFTVLNLALTGILLGFEKYSIIAKILISSSLITTTISMVTTYFLKFDGAVIGLLLGACITTLGSFLSIKTEFKKIKGETIFLKAAISRIIWTGIPTMFSSMVPILSLWYVNLSLSRSTDGYFGLGILDAAMRYTSVIVLIPNSMAQVILPLLNQNVSNIKKYSMLVKSTVFMNLVVSILITLLILVFSRKLMGLYDSKFSDSYYILIILCCSTIFISINSIFSQIFLTHNAVWIGFILNILWAMLYIFGSVYSLHNFYGVKGIAFSHLFSYFFHTLLQFITYHFILRKYKF